MYTIKRAAEQIGVSVSTLRAWERRYGVGAAQRTDSGYRLYDEEAVSALKLMTSLVAEGWSVRAAAEEVNSRTARSLAGAPAQAGVAPLPGLDVVDIRALARIAAEFDVAGLTAVLDQQFSSASFEAVVDGWLLPALSEVGVGWESGRIAVAGEHLVAGAVERRLAAAYDAAARNPDGPRVLLGLPRGVRHELGLLAFAAAARRAGLATTWLGADLPVEDWATAVEARAADCVVMAVPTFDDVPAATDTVIALAATHPETLVAVGGGAQHQAPQSCLRLGHEIGPAAALLARRLSSRSVSPPSRRAP